MKVSPYRRSSLLLPSAWWACVTLFIQAPGSQVQEPPSAVCVNLQGLGHPFLLGDPWGVFAEAAGQSCSWCGTALPLAWAAIPEGTLSSAQPRDSYWAPRLLPKTCSSEWPGLISAGLVGKNSSSGSTCSGQRGLTAELLGPEGFTRPLPVLSSWGWKSHRGLRGSYPTHSHLNLSAVGQLLGGSSASLGSHHFWNPRCPAGSVPSVAAPPPFLSMWDVPTGYDPSDGHYTTSLHWTGLSYQVNQQIHAHTMWRTWGDKACPPTARPRHV